MGYIVVVEILSFLFKFFNVFKRVLHFLVYETTKRAGAFMRLYTFPMYLVMLHINTSENQLVK